MYEEFIALPFNEEEGSKLIYDQRKLNPGRLEGDFLIFYSELDTMLEEYGETAEERRCSLVAHMPLAVSVQQLLRKVLRLLIFVIFENDGILYANAVARLDHNQMQKTF